MAATLLYSLTLALSASLLFVVQPMIGKAVLPILGGTPATWAVCMLYFQLLLLLAYAYAHLVVRWLPYTAQLALHAVLIAAAVIYPLKTGVLEPLPPDESPQVFLLRWLFITSGLSYFAVSATAPLLQSWFSRLRHAGADDPYFLYAASNAGSLFGLLSYPFLVEPAWNLAQQETRWRTAFMICGGMVLVCGAVFPARSGAEPAGKTERTAPARLSWLFLSFVPSSLLLAITMHITTNVSPVPLFWVLPLALYLLTFVAAFSKFGDAMRPRLRRYLPLIALPFAPLVFVSGSSELLLIMMQLFFFFATCLYCHVELAGRRPNASGLTEFYLYMSFGGVLGGIFNALAAPVIFNSAPEYPLMLCAVTFLWAVCGPKASPASKRHYVLAAAALAAGGAAYFAMESLSLPFSQELFFLYGIPALICFALVARPLFFAAVYSGLVLILALGQRDKTARVLFQDRNFFGVKEVRYNQTANVNELVHGVIVHGIQSADPAQKGVPLAYFHREGPVGDIFDAVGASHLRGNVGIIGLGVGAMATYANPGDRYDFFEIDPLVTKLARDTGHFTYLSDSKGTVSVIEGDGRLMLAKVPDRSYGIIFMDAFTSDAVPVHLLTKEAVDLYLSKLAAGGVLVFNISNNFLSFPDLLAPLAAEAGMSAFIRDDVDMSPEEAKRGRFASHYAVFTTNLNLGSALLETGRWRWLRASREIPVWRDHYSNIVSIMK